MDSDVALRRLTGIAAIAAASFAVAPAAAQQSASGESTKGEAAAESGSGGGQEGADEEKDKPDPNSPDYWSEIRKVHTVQKRDFQKVNRFSVTAYGGLIPNNIFERYFPVGIRLNYFILENLGIELAGSYAFQSNTRLEEILSEPSGVGAEGVRVADSQRSHTNFGIVWSPFYGKTALYDNAIGYFDMYVFGGMGMMVAKTAEQLNQPKEEIPTVIKPEGVLGGGIAFYLLENAAIRADFRQFAFQKETGGVSNPSEVSVGFGWFF